MVLRGCAEKRTVRGWERGKSDRKGGKERWRMRVVRRKHMKEKDKKRFAGGKESLRG